MDRAEKIAGTHCITRTSGGNVTGIIHILEFPAGKGTGADAEISGTSMDNREKAVGECLW